MTPDATFDIVVVGGGVNGAGIARDAAGRGLKVLLCEQDDLGAHTSSASSKLIHGGLRYLEYYEFRLVGKALAEREVVLRAAPHIVWPLRFVMPHVPGLRPGWLIRMGLFLYDHLDFGKRKLLPGSGGIDLHSHPAGEPLAPGPTKGFVYSDAWVEDSRLVVLNAVDAAERGAEILPRTRCLSASRDNGLWSVTLRSSLNGAERTVQGRSLVNASGPWVTHFLEGALQNQRTLKIRQVKGSHIVVPKLFDHPFAYIFQNVDKRIVFALPYEDAYTLIGTTDLEYQGDPADVAITEDEKSYLCELANRYFTKQITVDDIVHAFSGVRPLLDDDAGSASAVTRDYKLDLDTGGAPLLSIYGGKITTFRKLAEDAVDKLSPLLGNKAPAWTATDAPLPGGDVENADFETFAAAFHGRHPWLPDRLALRLARAYGTRADAIIGDAQGLNGLGAHLGDDLYAAEARYLIDREWAMSTDDILWRRSKLGLHVSEETTGRLRAWLESNREGHR